MHRYQKESTYRRSIGVPLSGADYDRCMRLAEVRGVPISTLVRSILRQEMCRCGMLSPEECRMLGVEPDPKMIVSNDDPDDDTDDL